MALDTDVEIALDLFDAVIFDMDGVVTNSAATHRESWKVTLDDFLVEKIGQNAEPFNEANDYLTYIDGRPRHDGVRSFLASRRITLPEGTPGDAPGTQTVAGIGNRKNEVFSSLIAANGVDVYQTTMALIATMDRAGLGLALVTSSRNMDLILGAAGATGIFEVAIGGRESARRGLPGKPAPDAFLSAALELGVKPERTVIFEDAQSGVVAGRAGNFGLVVGVARVDNESDLRRAGAHAVVADLTAVRIEPLAAPH